jgi:RND family efflux transporter MFP subunit
MNRIHWSGILFLSCLALAGCEHAQSQTPGQVVQLPPPKVEYTMPQVKPVTDYEVFTGHTAANNSVDLKAQSVSGYLVKVDFVDGAEVSEGAVLFEIDARPYEALLNQAKAKVTQDEAQLKFDEAEYQRDLILVQHQAVSNSDLDKVHAARDVDLANIVADKAAVSAAELNVGYTKVRAPLSGRVGRRMVDPGNFVAAGAAASGATVLTTIVADDPIYGYFDVDEHTVVRLRRLVEQRKVNRDIDLPVSLAIWDETDFPHPGSINFIDNRLDPQTGTIEFRGTFANHDHLLNPGQFIRVRLPIGPPHDAVVIPEAALEIDQGRQFVYVINGKNEAVYTPVETGPQYPGELRVIEKGLSTGDRVVVSGLQRVARSGMKVEPKEWKPAEASKGAEKVSSTSDAKASDRK